MGNMFKKFFNKTTPSEGTTVPLRDAVQFGTTHNGTRDIYSIFGYPNPEILGFDEYEARYERQGVATRIVEAYPDAVWSKPPKVSADLNYTDITDVEKSANATLKAIKAYETLREADIMCGIGRFSLIVLGMADAKTLEQPFTGSIGADKLVYMRVFGEGNVQIETTVNDTSNPRFGLPETYKVKMKTSGGVQTVSQDVIIHHSRTIHVTKGLVKDRVYGTPTLRPVFNNLIDLEKVVGGSSEIFWANGRGGVHVNAKDANKVSKDNANAIIEGAKEYINKMTRFLVTQNVDVKTLEQTVATPIDHFNVIMDAISSATKIPKRILLGSERGEMASSQDESNWWTRISEYREFESNKLFGAFVDKMAEIGVITLPNDYNIVWQELRSQSGKDLAEIASKKAIALTNYANSERAINISPPKQFFEDILGIEYREDMLREFISSDTYTRLKEMRPDAKPNAQLGPEK